MSLKILLNNSLPGIYPNPAYNRFENFLIGYYNLSLLININWKGPITEHTYYLPKLSKAIKQHKKLKTIYNFLIYINKIKKC